MRKRFFPLLAAVAAGISLLVLGPATPAHATVYEYSCAPTGSTWDVVGRWGDGTVMERRVCIRWDSAAHKVSSYSYWRTRRGTTAIKSDWDLAGTVADVYSYDTNFTYGRRDNYGDAIGTSFVKISSYWGCSNAAVPQMYEARVFNVRANPWGSNPFSGYKDGTSWFTIDVGIGC